MAEEREIKHRAKGGGRKKIILDKSTFENLCALQATKEEIAFAFGVAQNTLQAWIKDNYNGETFKTVFNRYRQAGFITLRRELFKQAKVSPKVLLTMASHYLGIQGEQQQNNNTVNISAETIKSFDNVVNSLQERSEEIDLDKLNEENNLNE